MREGVLRVLDSISSPAYVRNNRMDVLAANRLGRALFATVYAEGAAGFNLARYLFLDPRSRDFYTQWDVVARDSVAALRIEAGRNPYDRGLTIITYTVEPHSASEQALNFLASWSAQASPANPRESDTIEETT